MESARKSRMLFSSHEKKKALLSGWMVGKLQHNTHSHCRAGSERNFSDIRVVFPEKRKKREEIGCVKTRKERKEKKSSKLHNFRVLRDFTEANFDVN